MVYRDVCKLLRKGASCAATAGTGLYHYQCDNTNKQFKHQLETTKRYHGNTWNKNMGKTNPTNITYLNIASMHRDVDYILN
jgi:hypothetical protein